jgi:circadian clock protein KaiB
VSVHLRLYVAGRAPNSAAAQRNLQRILELTGRTDVELEIVDVFLEPKRAAKDGVLVTPTLMRISPGPPCSIVGNLGDGARVRALLDLEDAP